MEAEANWTMTLFSCLNLRKEKHGSASLIHSASFLFGGIDIWLLTELGQSRGLIQQKQKQFYTGLAPEQDH